MYITVSRGFIACFVDAVVLCMLQRLAYRSSLIEVKQTKLNAHKKLPTCFDCSKLFKAQCSLYDTKHYK